MPKPKTSEERVRHEMKLIGDAIGPRLGEFVDGFMVLGIRAGDHETAWHLTQTDPSMTEAEEAAMERRIENTILKLARDIMKKRNGQT